MGLLEMAQAGDNRAFEQLIRPHVASVRRFAFAFTRNWDDADDLAQDALIKAFRALPSFESKSSLSTWLYTVTRNTCHDYYRGRLAKTRELEDAFDEAAARDETDRDQEELLLEKATAEQLWTAIRQLPPEFKVVVVLCDVEGLSYAEVAEVEQVPIGTVRSRLSRARSKLKQLLGDVAGARSRGPAHLVVVRGQRESMP